MRILGIDPGSRHTGYGVIDKKGSHLTPVRFGRISPPSNAKLPERLVFLNSEIANLLRELEPDIAALEAPFKGLNPRSLIVLAQTRGALLSMLAVQGLAIHEYSPAEVKIAVSGYGRAAKTQVMKMVCAILSLQKKKPDSDAADALAVAICCAHRERFENLGAQ